MNPVGAVLKTALVGWWSALTTFLRALCGWIRHLVTEDEQTERERKAAKSRCVPIRDPAYVRPAPLIYSQQFLAAHGLNYSWNNPDFGLFSNGQKVDAHELEPATTYDVVVRVWNASPDGPVVAMPVHLSYLSFGIGTVSHPIATEQVDVGVIGGVDNPAFVTMQWQTPATAGHYCLQALLDPVDDVDYTNNLGQHNTDVVAAHSPAISTFTLRNDARTERAYWFAYDAYEVGEPEPCVQRRAAQPDDRIPSRHRVAQPLPEGWDVTISPARPTLAPGAALTVTATVTPPDTFVTGSQPVNIHAYYREFYADELAGGVTITVTRA